MNSTSIRRMLLDTALNAHIPLMKGNVLDIGGKKEKKRGNFRPPVQQVESWKYLNIDESTKPDYCCNATNIPVADGMFDTTLLCEVLEHLEDPEKVLKECYRVLKADGSLIATTPFLFPVHADPYDYQRWTNTKIMLVLKSIGFSDIKITPMGGTFAVIYDLLYVHSGFGARKREAMPNRLFRKIIMPILRTLFLRLELLYRTDRITTGYYIVARK